jgi:hypothetical protein
LWVAVVCFSSTVWAQCYIDPSTGQRICSRPFGSSQVAVNSAAHCRVCVADGSLGSGSLVARDDSRGIVLTCSHLFDGSDGPIVVSFPGGQRFAATLVDRDRAHDLAALAIRRPEIAPLTVGSEETTSALTACGFGSNGQFRCVAGTVSGRALAAGATFPSLTIRGAVRPGDSGGAVLNTRGELVGVVWGQRDGFTYATCGRPVREFLARFAKRAPSQPPAPPGVREPELDWRAWTNEIDARLRALDAKKQDKGIYLQPGDLNGYLRAVDAPKFDAHLFARRAELDDRLNAVSSRFDTVRSQVDSMRKFVDQSATEKVGVLAGLSWGKLAVGALGLSGPVAAAVVIAGGLVGRRVKSRVEGRESRARKLPALDSQVSTCDVHPVAVDSPPPAQRTVPETHYVPVEKDTFAKAHQWASEHVARKYPGATEVLQAQESLIKQFLSAQ